MELGENLISKMSVVYWAMKSGRRYNRTLSVLKQTTGEDEGSAAKENERVVKRSGKYTGQKTPHVVLMSVQTGCGGSRSLMVPLWARREAI